MGFVPKRIGIFGNFGIGNFGNDATLQAILLFLREIRPDGEITCVCTDPEKVHLDHRIPALPVRWPGPAFARKLGHWIYAINVVKKFDVLIIPGTGILNDYCVPPFTLPYILFRWCLAAKLCRVRIALVSVGAGPLHHPISRWFMKRVASMAQYRSYRNQYSKEYLRNLGVDVKNDYVYPDIVFRLTTLPPIEKSGEARNLTVCVGAMAYHGWRGHLRTDDKIYENYLGKITEFVIWLLERGHRVRMLMGDEGDQQAVDDLVGAVLAKNPNLPKGMLITDPAHSSHEVFRQMADADIVISSRFHHLVFAFMLGKLVISTGYSEYHNELMADIGMGAFCQHSEHLEIELLTAHFAELMSNRSYYEAIVRNGVNIARERLAHQDRVLTSQFLEAEHHAPSIRSSQRTPLSS